MYNVINLSVNLSVWYLVKDQPNLMEVHVRKQIMHLSVHQTSKVIASVYALITLLIAIPMGIYTIINGDIIGGLTMLIFLPILYWIFFYITHVIVCWVYNQVVKKLGGIELDLKDLQVGLGPVIQTDRPIDPDREVL